MNYLKGVWHYLTFSSFFFFVKGTKIKSCPLDEEIEIHLCDSRLIMIIFCQVG